jgi:hypothetical protein
MGVHGETEVEHQGDRGGVARLGGADHRRRLLGGGEAAGQPGILGQLPLDGGLVPVLAGGQEPVGAGGVVGGAALA